MLCKHLFLTPYVKYFSRNYWVCSLCYFILSITEEKKDVGKIDVTYVIDVGVKEQEKASVSFTAITNFLKKKENARFQLLLYSNEGFSKNSRK